MKTTTTIEPLESRIAPAAIVVTYADLDGDLVRITASKAGLVAPPLDLTDLTLTGGAMRPALLALMRTRSPSRSL